MRHWSTTFITNGILLGSGLLSGVVLARVLGAEDRGLLAAIIYWPHFVVGIAALGLNEGTVIHISSRGERATTAATVLAATLLLATIAAAACWLVLGYALSGARSDYLGFARMYACVLALSSFLFINMLAFSQGNMRFTEFNATRVVQTGIYPAALIGLWLTGLITVRTAAVAALLGGLLIGPVLLYRNRGGLRHLPSLTEAMELGASSVKIHAVNVLMSLTQQLDRMILVVWATNLQLGHYVIAYTAAATAPNVLVQTFINIMLPSAAKSGAGGMSRDEVTHSLRLVFSLIAGATVVMILLLPVLLPLVFGRDFEPAVPFAQVLCLAMLAAGIRKCFVYLLRSWQITRPALWGEGTTACMILLGGFPAFHFAGVIGLCWLLVIAQLLGTAVVWRKFVVVLKQQ